MGRQRLKFYSRRSLRGRGFFGEVFRFLPLALSLSETKTIFKAIKKTVLVTLEKRHIGMTAFNELRA